MVISNINNNTILTMRKKKEKIGKIYIVLFSITGVFLRGLPLSCNLQTKR